MKSFLWLGSEEVQGGKCLIAWCRVQIPMQCGGLVISNPLLVGMALRLRWPWLQSTDLSRPWIHLSVQEDQATKAFFSERRCATSSAMGPRSSSGLTHGLWCRPLRTSRLTWSLPFQVAAKSHDRLLQPYPTTLGSETSLALSGCWFLLNNLSYDNKSLELLWTQTNRMADIHSQCQRALEGPGPEQVFHVHLACPAWQVLDIGEIAATRSPQQ
jgi:hypothetical protein